MAFQRRKPASIGVKAPYPGFIEPALATPIDKVPNGERWIHEIKFDGYRVQLHIANENTPVFTRNGQALDPAVQEDSQRSVPDRCQFGDPDGEVVVPAAGGTADFSVLQNELKGKSSRIVMVVFDLL
jgi:bifunctional non-homologous end joining protein LigD